VRSESAEPGLAGVDIFLARLHSTARETLAADGVLTEIGADRIYDSAQTAVAAASPSKGEPEGSRLDDRNDPARPGRAPLVPWKARSPLMWDLVLLGLIITLEPVPVAGFILLLSTTGGAKKGLAYIAGWVTCLMVIVVGTLAVTGGHPPRAHSLPGRGVSAATVLIGVILVAFAVIERRRLRAGPRAPKPPPKWASKVDNMSSWASAGLGVLLQPWPLVVAGAALVAEANISSVASVVSLVLFCLLSTASILVMEGYMVFAHDDATARLAALRKWLNRNRDSVLAVLALIAGLLLMAKGSYQLTQ
jgi:hypothetical protein